jgi:hypothetical protein
MRHPYAAITLILLAGCQQPADVELTPDKGQSALEVLSVVVPDTNLSLGSIDTLAVLPEEQVSFRAHFLVHRVTLDAGAGKSTFAYGRVFVADTAVRWLGQTVGFDGKNVGAVALNGATMTQIAHRIPIPTLSVRDTSIIRGVEYVVDLTAVYLPAKGYVWSFVPAVTGFPSQSVRTPDALAVLSPLGGAVIDRDRDLLLRWEGNSGRISIVLSIFEPLTRRTRPILELRPVTNTGKAVLPAKLLESLPRLKRYYVFTFILANRSGADITQPVSGKVLAQAADVYNSFVEIR